MRDYVQKSHGLSFSQGRLPWKFSRSDRGGKVKQITHGTVICIDDKKGCILVILLGRIRRMGCSIDTVTPVPEVGGSRLVMYMCRGRLSVVG